MVTEIFTDRRRELLAQTIMDMAKIVLGAAFASQFFSQFPDLVRKSLIFAFALIIIAGTLICPKEGK